MFYLRRILTAKLLKGKLSDKCRIEFIPSHRITDHFTTVEKKEYPTMEIAARQIRVKQLKNAYKDGNW